MTTFSFEKCPVDFEAKLNDSGFVGTVGGEFQAGTDENSPWDYFAAKRDGGAPPLDYRLDSFAARCIVFDICGPP